MHTRNRYRIASFLLVASSVAAAGDARVQRVEPASWWQGFQDSTLQLMIHGKDASGLQVSIDYAGVTLERVVRVANPHYLFVYLDIGKDAQPGSFPILFQDGSYREEYRYTLNRKNGAADHARGFTNADAIYLITPDRYANGEPGNDNVEGYADTAARNAPGGRHGGDLQGIRNSLDYIEDMGFTAIWLNPVLENAMPTYSYHGYSTTDFYKVDPRFGSNEDYRALADAARARGIGLIMDMIVNHIGSEHWWMNDLPAPDWLNHPGQPVITTHERTSLQDPYAAESDVAAFADGWFVTSMPDLNQRNELLGDYLVQNALWWIEYLGLSGIRMDTYPYPDKAFMARWTRRIMQEYPDFNIVGEEWTQNQPTVAYWQRGQVNRDGYVSWLPSLMDFPLQAALTGALVADGGAQDSGWIRLYRTLANDFVYADPASLVIFADNHDMSRIYTQLGEDFDLFRMAMVYILTMRGTPQIYYGTEVLMTNRASEDHGLIRSDFPGGWNGDRVNAFSGDGLTSAQAKAQAMLRKLLHWRAAQPAVQGGRLLHYVPRDGVYVYFRHDDTHRIMVVFNRNDSAARLATGRFAEGLAGRTTGKDVLSGRRYALDGTLVIPARATLLLELDPKRSAQ